MNNVALVEGRPHTMGLKEMLQVWVDHRRVVIRRRSEYRKKKALERLHLVEGLLLAMLDIDEVIQVIRTSDDADAAKSRLMVVFDLDEVQAQYILDLRLRRLTKMNRIELEAERDDLKKRIEDGTSMDLSDANPTIRMCLEITPKNITRIDSNCIELTENALPGLVQAESDEAFQSAKDYSSLQTLA